MNTTQHLMPITDAPARDGYDVVIIGGAMIGSAIARFTAAHPDFDGTVLVVERDLSYDEAGTSRTNSCMRQQFSNPLNVAISRFAADHIRNFRDELGGDPEIPDIFTDFFGYMYLAADEAFADVLRTNQAAQAEMGAATRILSPDDIAARFPFYNVDDLVCGSHNPVDEGYWDSGTVFDWWRRDARRHGVEYTVGEVVALGSAGDRVASVRLASGDEVEAATVVCAAGTRAADVAAMAGIELAVEPRKRFTWIFDCAVPLGQQLPLTIDPSGIHVRSEGEAFMTGCKPDADVAVEPDDFVMDDDLFEDKVWPVLAHRIPAFERIKVTQRWAGHYAYHPLDHNVVVGPHPEIANFVFANGFSGHGLQQSPAIGRGIAELLVDGSYQTLDLTPLGFQRIIDNEPFIETAII